MNHSELQRLVDETFASSDISDYQEVAEILLSSDIGSISFVDMMYTIIVSIEDFYVYGELSQKTKMAIADRCVQLWNDYSPALLSLQVNSQKVNSFYSDILSILEMLNTNQAKCEVIIQSLDKYDLEDLTSKQYKRLLGRNA